MHARIVHVAVLGWLEEAGWKLCLSVCKVGSSSDRVALLPQAECQCVAVWKHGLLSTRSPFPLAMPAPACPRRSRSPAIHNAALQQLGLNAVYVPLLVDDMARFLAAFTGGEGMGCLGALWVAADYSSRGALAAS